MGLSDMNTPSIHDGYRGAGDAANLEHFDLDDDIAHVQCNYRTKGLLRRAGIPNPVENEHYPVRVIVDKFNRLQVAPV
jgi:hypothetical protein